MIVPWRAWSVNLCFIVVVQLGSLSGRAIGNGTDSMSASESRDQQVAVDQLELQFYETQLELYDTKFEILKNEEQLLVAQIDSLRRQIKGRWLAPWSFMDWEQVFNTLPSTKLMATYSDRM